MPPTWFPDDAPAEVVQGARTFADAMNRAALGEF
jgi:hypothetical protein